jgi:hypothetical protein
MFIISAIQRKTAPIPACAAATLLYANCIIKPPSRSVNRLRHHGLLRQFTATASPIVRNKSSLGAAVGHGGAMVSRVAGAPAAPGFRGNVIGLTLKVRRCHVGERRIAPV